MNSLMYKTWISVRKEWLETCRGITGGTMEDTLLFAMDSEPIPCDEMPDTFNTKYAECILKLNATILLVDGLLVDGFIVYGGKIWVGTVTDHTIGQMDGNQDMLVANDAQSLVDGGYTQSRQLEIPQRYTLFDFETGRRLTSTSKRHTIKKFTTPYIRIGGVAWSTSLAEISWGGGKYSMNGATLWVFWKMQSRV